MNWSLLKQKKAKCFLLLSLILFFVSIGICFLASFFKTDHNYFNAAGSFVIAFVCPVYFYAAHNEKSVLNRYNGCYITADHVDKDGEGRRSSF